MTGLPGLVLTALSWTYFIIAIKDEHFLDGSSLVLLVPIDINLYLHIR